MGSNSAVINVCFDGLGGGGGEVRKAFRAKAEARLARGAGMQIL